MNFAGFLGDQQWSQPGLWDAKRWTFWSTRGMKLVKLVGWHHWFLGFIVFVGLPPKDMYMYTIYLHINTGKWKKNIGKTWGYVKYADISSFGDVFAWDLRESTEATSTWEDHALIVGRGLYTEIVNSTLFLFFPLSVAKQCFEYSWCFRLSLKQV